MVQLLLVELAGSGCYFRLHVCPLPSFRDIVWNELRVLESKAVELLGRSVWLLV